MSFDLFQYLATLGFLYIYGRLVLHYGSIFLSYMLDQAITWKASFEKPRILFILVGLGLMHLIFYAHYSLTTENYLLQGISFSAFALGLFLSHLPWTDKFNIALQVHKPAPIKNKSCNFDLAISDAQIQQLYRELVRYDLINSEKTNLQDFKNVLTRHWNDHASKIHFNMDAPSCREFYDHLVKTFPRNSITLKNFFDTSKLFLRPDGKSFNYNTIKNSPTRSSYSKKHSELKEIFQKIEGQQFTSN